MYFSKFNMTGSKSRHTFVFEVGQIPYVKVGDKNMVIHLIDGYQIIGVGHIRMDDGQVIVNVNTQWQKQKDLVYDMEMLKSYEIVMNSDGVEMNAIVDEEEQERQLKRDESVSVNKELLGITIDENHRFNDLLNKFEMLTGKKLDEKLLQDIAKLGDDAYSPMTVVNDSVKKIRSEYEYWHRNLWFENDEYRNRFEIIKHELDAVIKLSEDIINESKKKGR